MVGFVGYAEARYQFVGVMRLIEKHTITRKIKLGRIKTSLSSIILLFKYYVVSYL